MRNPAYKAAQEEDTMSSNEHAKLAGGTSRPWPWKEQFLLDLIARWRLPAQPRAVARQTV